MMRVVDVLPGRDEIKAAGLVEKDFRIDPDAYRHFVELYRSDFSAFKRTFSGNVPTEGGVTHPFRADSALTASDETCMEAFDRSRPPYCYHQGSIYRYQLDRTGPVERPIILETLERSEITGSLLGIPFTSHHQSLLMRLSLWIEERLRARTEKG